MNTVLNVRIYLLYEVMVTLEKYTLSLKLLSKMSWMYRLLK